MVRWRGLGLTAAPGQASGGWHRLSGRRTCFQRASAARGDMGIQEQPVTGLATSQRHEQLWQQRCKQVAAFQQAHSWLPRAVADGRGPLDKGERELGLWISNQQRRKEGSRGTALTLAEVAALEAIPGWRWGAARPARMRVQVPWEQRCQQVAAFVQQHGRLPRRVAVKVMPSLAGEKQLGAWCAEQRLRRKGNRQSQLTQHQEAALEAIPGWVWEVYTVEPWEQWCQQVAAFVQQHGRLPRKTAGASTPFLDGEATLGSWCGRQRLRRKGNGRQAPLSSEQVVALEDIPGWVWEEFSVEPWEQRCQQVAAFVQQHGRLPRMAAGASKPFLHGEVTLGSWCTTQRQRRKGNGRQAPLSSEQVAALEAIPGWVWEEFSVEPWEQRCQQVAAFVQQHGRLPRMAAGASKPFLHGEVTLGSWCTTQRQRRKGNGRQAPLSSEQVAALEAIPGWVWEEFSMEPWDQRYQQAAAFVQQHGRLPRSAPGASKPLLEEEAQLEGWCSRQRQRRRGKGGAPLSVEQVAALEAIPGWRW